MTAELSTPERLRACEVVIEAGLRTFIEVGQALSTVRDERLYRESYETFEDYCRTRWKLSRSRAYQMIDASTLTQSVSTIVDTPTPINEGQARALAGLEPEVAAEVLRETAQEGGGNITARAIGRVREKIAPRRKRPPVVIDPEPTRRSEPIGQPQPNPAVRQGVENDPRWRAAMYGKEFSEALTRSRVFMERFTAEDVAQMCGEDIVVSIEHHIKDVQEYLERVRRARSGLRVVQGGRA